MGVQLKEVVEMTATATAAQVRKAVEQEFMASISEIESTKKTVSRCRRCEEVQREFRIFKEGAEEQRKVMNRDVKGLKKECTRFCESWMEAMKENMEMEAYIMP